MGLQGAVLGGLRPQDLPQPPPGPGSSPTCGRVAGQVLVIRVGEDLGQLLVGHVSQLGEVQEVEVHLQGRDAAQGLWGQRGVSAGPGGGQCGGNEVGLAHPRHLLPGAHPRPRDPPLVPGSTLGQVGCTYAASP